ncbi:MAG: hypothetical protein SF002_16690 [Alphaproteobacteria bacterium]|nr:hypothetical protein [Alphaproteobacteria bacterium]
MTTYSNELDEFLAVAKELSFGYARLRVSAVEARGWVGIPLWCSLIPSWDEVTTLISALAKCGVDRLAWIGTEQYEVTDNPIQALTKQNIQDAELNQPLVRIMISGNKNFIMTSDTDLLRYAAGPIGLMEEIYGKPLSKYFDEMEEHTSSEYFRVRIPAQLQEDWLQDIADLRNLLDSVEAKRSPAT